MLKSVGELMLVVALSVIGFCPKHLHDKGPKKGCGGGDAAERIFNAGFAG